MDVSDASYYIKKKKNRGSQMGHTKKKFKKESKTTYLSANYVRW